MKGFLKNRLDYIYLLMCILNYALIFFIGAIVTISIQRIIDIARARSFMDMLDYLPGDGLTNFIFSMICFFVLLFIMIIPRMRKLNGKEIIIYYAFEICLCLLIIKNTYFTSNVILLLVMADAMTYTPSNKYRILILVVLFVLYMGAIRDFISPFYSVASFENFTSIYSSQTIAVLLGTKNTLVSLNIVAFMLYLFFLVQDKIEENQRFISLNKQLQEANKQLRDYADISEKMGETKERNRLAREMHDTLGHTLTGISVGLEACQVILDKDRDMAKQQLKLLSENARRGLDDVRRSVDKLKPDALERYTLKEALDILMFDFQKMTDVSIRYMCHIPSLELEQDEQEVVYRIVQEGITNAVRHGHASVIYVTIAKEGNTLILIIEDNGKGCKDIKKGFGLNHMQDRIDLLHGDIRFYGQNGFTIIAEIPIRQGE